MWLLVFGVLLSPLSGTSWVGLVDASPRAASPTSAKELAAGLRVTPWTAALGPGLSRALWDISKVDTEMSLKGEHWSFLSHVSSALWTRRAHFVFSLHKSLQLKLMCLQARQGKVRALGHSLVTSRHHRKRCAGLK